MLCLCALLDAQVSSTVGSKPSIARFSFLSVTASPFMGIPVGADAGVFNMSFGGGASAEYRLPFFPTAFVGGRLDYGFLPTPNPATSLSTLAFSGLAGVHLQLSPALSLKLFGSGGAFVAFLNGGGMPAEANPVVSGGLRVEYDFSPSFGIGAEGSYRYYAGLVSDVGVRVSGIYRIPAFSSAGSKGSLPAGFTPLESSGSGVGLIGYKADPIYPVFSKYYDSHPFAEIRVRNFEASTADSVKMTAIIKDYMDGARECSVPVRIEPGREVTAQVFGLFNDRLLQVAESTKFTLTVVLEYSQFGKQYREEYSPSVEVLFRNAMTWEDSKRMAAFISARDPSAFGFTRGVLSAARSSFNPALSQDLQAAILLYEALRVYGMGYVKDPSSALAANKTTIVDSLQFPQQTLQFKSGDCDDLTILFCALLESLGTETGFITTPGHVYPAFVLSVRPADAVKYLGKDADFVIREGKVWVPLEITLLGQDFMAAWREGAKEWATAADKAVLYPVHEAWDLYPPVVMSGTAGAPAIPAASRLTTSLKAQLQKLMERELTPRASALINESKKAGSAQKSLNSLGILYARYGQYDRAEEQFNALASKSYIPAMINLGNLYLVERKYSQAAVQFQKILKGMPDDPAGLVGAALASDGMGDEAAARTAYAKLKSTNPELADRYAYLGSQSSDSTARAASADAASQDVPWSD